VEHSAWKLFFNTWFVPSYGQGIRFPLTDPLILLVLTIFGGIGLLSVEKPDSLPALHYFRPAVGIAFGFLGLVWLVFGILSAIFWAALDSSISSPINESLHAEARMTLFYSGLILFLGIAAWSLVSAGSQRHAAATPIRASRWVAGLLLAIGASIGIVNFTVYPAWAEAASHIAHIYENSKNLKDALPVYERAANLAPDDISYRISLGLAQARTIDSSGKTEEEAFQSLKHALDLNPLDPVVFGALGSFYAQLGERSPDPAVRNIQIQKAIPYFERAVRLAPNNPQQYNELGRGYALLGDFAKANSMHEKALRLHPVNAKTYLFLGEMYSRQKDLERALQSYSQAAKYGGGLEAQRHVGLFLALMGRYQEAMRADLDALKTAPQDSQLLSHLAVLCFSLGDVTSGLDYAHRGYEASHISGNNISVETYIMMLEDQAKKLLEQEK
jgi:tetratricopeptide (TPR) repeat protein